VSASPETVQRFSCTVSKQMVSLQYELLNVNANEMIGKTTSYIGGTDRVSRLCELSNVFAEHLAEKMTLYKGSKKMVSLQCELLNVNAN
jgi:hypothetical protein